MRSAIRLSNATYNLLCMFEVAFILLVNLLTQVSPTSLSPPGEPQLAAAFCPQKISIKASLVTSH